MYSETTLKRYVALCLSSALPFRSPPVGGSRNENAALKRSASHLDKQDDFKVDWLYNLLKRFLAVLLLALLPLFAQSQWVGDYFIVDTADFSPDKRFLDDNNRVHKIIPNITKVTDFPVERQYLVFALMSFGVMMSYTLALWDQAKRKMELNIRAIRLQNTLIMFGIISVGLNPKALPLRRYLVTTIALLLFHLNVI
jgi:hypothetical protein